MLARISHKVWEGLAFGPRRRRIVSTGLELWVIDDGGRLPPCSRSGEALPRQGRYMPTCRRGQIPTSLSPASGKPVRHLGVDVPQHLSELATTARGDRRLYSHSVSSDPPKRFLNTLPSHASSKIRQ
jgi:hypothetical protein